MSSTKEVLQRVRGQIESGNFVKKDIEHLARIYEIYEELKDAFMMFSKSNLVNGSRNYEGVKIDFAHLFASFHKLNTMAENVAMDLFKAELHERKEEIRKARQRQTKKDLDASK